MSAEHPVQGAEIYMAPGLHEAKVRLLATHPSAFVSMCEIVKEDESIGFLDPTPAQLQIMDAYANHRWIMVNKYRQAKVTTISVMLLLRDCMYFEGMRGLLVAERQDTAEDIFERILFAYNRLPDDVKVPLATGRKAGVTQMHFAHGGNIKVLTAGGRSPAIGRSIARLVITEFGEAQWQAKAAANMFPTLNKRPNARVVLESTPGRGGSHHETMWHKALEGKSRFHPVFLEWWKDDTCRTNPGGVHLPEEDFDLKEQLEGITAEALAFRRVSLETEFAGDPRLFSSKYPSDPYDGWIGSGDPIIPDDVLRPLLEGAVAAPLRPSGCHELANPQHNIPYLITADPAGFGSSGDNSALMVWHACSPFHDVAYWEGRETPDRFARRLLRVQARFGGPARCMIAVESNAAACIAVLKDMGTENLLWTDRNHPGWYATDKRLQEAEALLVRMVYQKDLRLFSKVALHQLLQYDGSRKKRKRNSDGTVHHFDLARCVVMAGDILSRRTFNMPTDDEPVPRLPGQVTIGDLDQLRRGAWQSWNSRYSPPPRSD